MDENYDNICEIPIVLSFLLSSKNKRQILCWYVQEKNLKNLQKKEAIPNQNLYILTNIIFTCILSLWEGQDLFGCIGGSIEEFYCVTREREHIDQLLLLRPMYFFLECWLYLWGDSCGIQINSWCQYTQFSSFFGRIFNCGRYMRPVLCVGRYWLE